MTAIEPHTEADPAALLLQFLTAFGNIAGRKTYFQVEADRHYLNLFTCLVGPTSKGRKGTSLGHVVKLYESIDPEWKADCIDHGLSTGEGLIWAVRDPIEETKPVKANGRFTGEYETTIADQGITDKRLLVVESEFARVLKTMQRDSNTLSAVIRQAWDSGDLRNKTKNSPAKATGAHVSIIGHITREELIRNLDSTETANGFFNRFLLALVKRSKVLPEGGRIQDVDFGPLTARLRQAVDFGTDAQLERDDQARTIWARIYPELSAGRPGLLGAVTARAEAQVVRLAGIYALLDTSFVIRNAHLRAATAVWSYCEASARFIFGDCLGDPVADEILRALRAAEGGLSRTEISSLFGRNQTATRINQALTSLMGAGLIYMEKVKGPGRATEVFHATK